MKTFIHPSVELLSMSSSKISATSCSRAYFWEYVLNLVPKKLNLPFWYGSVMHKAFEAMVNPKLRKNIYKIMDAESKAYLSKYALVADDSEEIQLQLKIAKITIKVYLEEYGDKNIQLTNPQTETKFETKLIESPVIYEGTIDLFGKKKAKTILVEHKTAKQINEAFLGLLKFDVQINGYANAIKNEIIGNYPSQCHYTVFRKPQIRVTKKETVEQFLTRLEEDLHDRKDWYYVTFIHKFGKRSINEVMSDIERFTAELHTKYTKLTQEQLLNPYYWPRRRSHCLWYGACQYIMLCKNCEKYHLYLRMFQQREMRYQLEKEELTKEPVQVCDSILKLNKSKIGRKANKRTITKRS